MHEPGNMQNWDHVFFAVVDSDMYLLLGCLCSFGRSRRR